MKMRRDKKHGAKENKIFNCSSTFIAKLHLEYPLPFSSLVISPKPIDQDPQENYVGIIVAVFVAIIVLLVGVIVVIISRHKKARRSDILGTLPHSMHQDSLTMDKRMNYNIKVSGLSFPQCSYRVFMHRHSCFCSPDGDGRQRVDRQEQSLPRAIQREHVHECGQWMFPE